MTYSNVTKRTNWSVPKQFFPLRQTRTSLKPILNKSAIQRKVVHEFIELAGLNSTSIQLLLIASQTKQNLLYFSYRN